jgi:hypothetical protein
MPENVKRFRALREMCRKIHEAYKARKICGTARFNTMVGQYQRLYNRPPRRALA